MSNSSAGKNSRVLVIDDNRSIHDDIRKILAAPSLTAVALDVIEAALFGRSADPIRQTQFEVDSAYQGKEGVLLVKQALEAGQPYAMAFVDVRMPPGLDGVETIQKIWELYPDIQIVLCTAYSDYSWDEMFAQLGHRDGLLILKKPFDTVEAFQLAHMLTEKWALCQQSRRKTEELKSMVAERTGLFWRAKHALRTEVAGHRLSRLEIQQLNADLERRQAQRGPDVVASTPSDGSAFWTNTPIDQLPVAPLDSNTLPSALDPGSGMLPPKILYIEDHLLNLRLITRILARRPAIELLSAATSALGLEMAREHRPHVILVDPCLADIHGDQLLAGLRADPATSQIPVIIFSFDAPPGERDRAPGGGASVFVAKPVEVRILLKVLDQFLEPPSREAG